MSHQTIYSSRTTSSTPTPRLVFSPAAKVLYPQRQAWLCALPCGSPRQPVPLPPSGDRRTGSARPLEQKQC